MNQQKTDFLKAEGLLNSRPERVTHPGFQTIPFFDPQDLPQVRYEMLRTVRAENGSVVEACREFGFSREYFYRLEHAFMERGYVALIGAPRGRRPIIASKPEIVRFIVQRKIEEPGFSGEDLRKEILRIYEVDCSRRTVERILQKTGFEKGGLHTF
jgi:transposase